MRELDITMKLVASDAGQAVALGVRDGVAEPPKGIEDAQRQRIVRELERKAIANEGVVRRCAMQTAQLAILGSISDALAGSSDVDHAIDEALASCLHAGGISTGALYRAGADGQLVLRNVIGFSEGDRATLETAARHASQVMTSGVPVSIPPTEGGHGESERASPDLGGGAAVAVPLLAGGQRVGVLFLGTPLRDVAESDLLAFSRTIAAHMGQAIALASAFEREQQARREAEQANRAKDEFLGLLSHELRTPVTAILGWASLLGTRASNPASLERAVATIRRNAKVQVQLIDDLFDVARINSGRIRLDAREMSVVQPIRAALDTLTPMAEAKGVRVEADLDSGAGTIWGDPERVEQMVWNLACNGVKFTPSGGSVKVRLERRGTWIRIEVSDDGEGIRADFLPHVFECFRQADSSTTRTHGGLGLGLWIAQHLVGLHGGEIQAESEGEGRGATFAITLPLHVPC